MDNILKSLGFSLDKEDYKALFKEYQRKASYYQDFESGTKPTMTKYVYKRNKIMKLLYDKYEITFETISDENDLGGRTFLNKYRMIEPTNENSEPINLQGAPASTRGDRLPPLGLRSFQARLPPLMSMPRRQTHSVHVKVGGKIKYKIRKSTKNLTLKRRPTKKRRHTKRRRPTKRR